MELVNQYLDPAKDALDIGANIGLFTVLIAQKLTSPHKVLAVEPTPLALSYLRRNLIRNGLADSVIVYEGLVADKGGPYTLKIIPGKEEYSSLGDMVHSSIVGRAYQVAQVEGETVDSLVTRFGLQPGLIKIDTEGAELLVLRGARQTLLKYHPILLSELADSLLNTLGGSSNQVVELLIELGYRIINVDYPEKPVQAPFDGSVLALPIDSEPRRAST
jgi:FkbM family methyltransferase